MRARVVVFTAVLLVAMFFLAPRAHPYAEESGHDEQHTAGNWVVAIDPGHGGHESGAVFRFTDGTALLEKHVNLDVSLRLAELLVASNIVAVLTRLDDTEVNRGRVDLNGDGFVNGDDDLQARVDIANEAGAHLLVSVHHNGSSDARTRGTSTWYCEEHPRGLESRILARLVQRAFISHLRRIGYADAVDLGARDDAGLRKPYGHLFLVGPQTPRIARPAAMPGVVGEALFVTSPLEARLLVSPDTRAAIAEAYYEAIVAFLYGTRLE